MDSITRRRHATAIIRFAKSITSVTIFKAFGVSFLLFASADITWKLITHSQYDMEGIVANFQADYPTSRLTFQNIRVEDNYHKVHRYNASGDTYKETRYFMIRNGQLVEDKTLPGLYVVLMTSCFLFVIGTSSSNESLWDALSRTEISIPMIIPLMVSGVLSMLLFSEDNDYENSYKSRYEFHNRTNDIQNSIDILQYARS